MTKHDLMMLTCTDAMEWTKYFRQKNPNCNIDDDVMLGWFANAMMAMHDHIMLRGQPINGDHAQWLVDNT